MKLFFSALIFSTAFGITTATTTKKNKDRKLRPSRSMMKVDLPNASHNNINPRIVGGTEASPGEYPFFAEGSGCGGSLIWKDIVLSAGHCQGAFAREARIGAYRVDAGEVRSKQPSKKQHVEFLPHL